MYGILKYFSFFFLICALFPTFVHWKLTEKSSEFERSNDKFLLQNDYIHLWNKQEIENSRNLSSNLASTTKRKVAVIGGGIAGLSTAYFLSKRGFEVEIFERNSWMGIYSIMTILSHLFIYFLSKKRLRC